MRQVFFGLRLLSGFISQFSNHRQCRHIEFWSCNCFFPATKTKLLNRNPILWSKCFMLGERLCNGKILEACTPLNFQPLCI